MAHRWIAGLLCVLGSAIPAFADEPLHTFRAIPTIPIVAPLVTAPPQSRGGMLSSLYASFVGLQAYDALSTSHGLSRGAAEGNPLMGTIAHNTPSLFVVKGAATAASIYVAERLWKQNRKGRAIALMVAANGFMFAVAARNAAVIRGLR